MVVTAGVNQHNVGAVLHLIGALGLADLAKRDIEPLRKAEDVRKLPRNAQKVGMKIRDILGQALGCVAGRVDRHHRNTGVPRFGVSQLRLELGELRHRGRTDIGAVGETKKHQRPVANQSRLGEWLGVVINQRKVAQRSRGIKNKQPVGPGFRYAHDARLANAMNKAGDHHCHEQQDPDDSQTHAALRRFRHRGSAPRVLQQKAEI